MLEKEILGQLQSVFQKLENNVELVYDQSKNSQQQELLDMLKAVASTSPRITIRESGQNSPIPHFEIRHAGSPTGVRFSGIPGGHEFTSLVLAILNCDKKGQLPDSHILERVRKLKGPISLKTYVSLSCENCPEVVQVLNLMAIFHTGFEHEMVDGAFAQPEVENLGIQGVPSIVSDGELIHSGKSNFIELLDKLEKHFGTKSTEKPLARDLGHFDVAVIGGGPAGASAAIYSARKGLRTVIVTEILGGQLKDTKGIENMISVPYTEGPQLANQITKHVREYDIEILEHRRVRTVRSEGPFKSIILNSNEALTARSLIVASGAKWRELGVPGEKEYLGRGVAFCPHCDGPYYKGKDIAVIGGGNSGVEAAIDLAGIVKSVTLIEFASELKADQVLVNKLTSLQNVKIVKNARTSQVLGDGSKVHALEYEDRATKQIKKLNLDGVFVQIGLVPNSAFICDQVETNKYGEIIIDEKCRTNVSGIYAAGDVTVVPYKQIVVAMGEGVKAALAAFEDQMLMAPAETSTLASQVS